MRSLTKKLVRGASSTSGIRMDGRGLTDIRPLSAEVGIIPTAHGSGLFQRGETQVLNVTTLGMPRMDQMLDTIGIDEKKRYMHHYNMPPYANGETGRVGGPKRREIGHGLLAERALLPVVPPMEEFPYTLRLVSEVLSSNGSTSMALGVRLDPLAHGRRRARSRRRSPASPWASSTPRATTSPSPTSSAPRTPSATWTSRWPARPSSSPPCSSTPRSTACPPRCSAHALRQAREARLTDPRGHARRHRRAPPDGARTRPRRSSSLEIPIDKIGEVIGPKGKVINALQQETGADIAVDDDGMVGTVTIGAKDGGRGRRGPAPHRADPGPARRPRWAPIYPGKVVNITKFGAFVNILPGRDGLLHISKLGPGQAGRAGRGRGRSRATRSRSGWTTSTRRARCRCRWSATTASPSRPRGHRSRPPGRRRGRRGDGRGRAATAAGPAGDVASFEDSFEEELEAEFGDLGPGRGRRDRTAAAATGRRPRSGAATPSPARRR